MTREVKLGLLTAITLAIFIWGYKFIIGQNLFKKNNTYYTSFSDVSGLAVSSDVLVNGYKIGTVTDIRLNPENVKSMDVYFVIEGNVAIPKETTVLLKSSGIMGGRNLTLLFDSQCKDNDCAPNGYKLKGKTVGLLNSMVPEEELSSYLDNTTKSARLLINDIGKEGNNAKLDLIVRNLESSLSNLNSTMSTLNKLMLQSQGNINGITGNLNSITKNLADNNTQISSILKNFNTTSQQLASLNLGNTIGKANNILESSTTSIKKLEATLETSNKAMASLNDVLFKVNQGGGSLGQLLNDKKLYTNLESTSKNLSLLLQDLRLNPKRYVNVSLIARKDKPYTVPKNDPALDTLN